MHNQDVFLEQTLLEEGRVTAEHLEEARRYGIEHQVDLVDALISTGAIHGREIALAKAGICEAPFAALEEFEACFTNTQLVPRAVAERYCLFPLFKIDNVLTLAMDDPLNLEAMDQARQFAKCEVDAVLCDREQLRPLISRAYRLTQVHTELIGMGTGPPRMTRGSGNGFSAGVTPLTVTAQELVLKVAGSMGRSKTTTISPMSLCPAVKSSGRVPMTVGTSGAESPKVKLPMSPVTPRLTSCPVRSLTCASSVKRTR